LTFAEIAPSAPLVVSALVLGVSDPVRPDRRRQGKQGTPV